MPCLRMIQGATAFPKKGHMLFKKARGFTLIEMLMAISIFMVASAFTFMSIQPALKDARVNNAYNLTLMTLRQARQTAVDARKIYIVSFVPPQTIQVFRQDGGTPAPPPVLTNTYSLPSDIRFDNEPGIPNTPTSTPDQFGIGAYPIDFAINVGGQGTSIFFKPDGGAYDLPGNINNGVLYLARPGELYSSRAITLFGLTGRLRGWRLYKNQQTGTSEWKPQ
jgi:prepilin-type N-terminal cleavage/methylation domain-containing protein